MRRATIGWVVVTVTLMSAARVNAQAIQSIVLRNAFAPVGAGARALGMGGAFIAVADDGTAATFNPAGLAQLRRSEFAVVAFGSNLTRTATGVPGFNVAAPGPTSRIHQAVDFVGLAMPFDIHGRRLVFQISYQRAVDLVGEGRATINQPGRRDAVIDIDPQQDGALHSISGTVAYQVTPRLSVGSSLNYWIGEWSAVGTRTVRTLGPRPQGGGPRTEVSRTETSFLQDQSLRGLSVNGGFLLRFPYVSFGGAVRFPFSATYALDESHSEVTIDGAGTSAPTTKNVGVTSQLHWPRTAGLGIALRPVEGLTISADYSMSRWSAAYIDGLPDGALLTPNADNGGTGGAPAGGDPGAGPGADGDANNPPGGADPNPAPTNFHDRNFFDLDNRTVTSTPDTTQWRAGAEYLLVLPQAVVPVRAGLFRDRSPITEGGTDNPRHYKGVTFGTGLNFNRVVFDIAFERRENDGALGLPDPTAAPGSNPNERVTENRVVASLIYRFDTDDPVKRWFKSLLGVTDDESETSDSAGESS